MIGCLHSCTQQLLALPLSVQVLAALGALVILRLVLTAACGFWRHFLAPSVTLRPKAKGAWAVVTGASDNIGKSYAEQLARRGFNVVLISRTLSKLQAAAAAIQAKNPGVQTAVIDEDMTAPDWKRIAAELRVGERTYEVLINNVGMSSEWPERFLEGNSQRDRDIIACNVTATNEMTRLVLPSMVQHKHGLVVSLSSASALVPTPLLSVYGASKAYMIAWSEALSSEYARENIRFEVQTPFFVVSNMSKVRRPSLSTPMPDTYVRTALAKAGRQTVSNPYWVHALMGWFVTALPHGLVVRQNRSMHESIRNRARAKAAREASGGSATAAASSARGGKKGQ